MTANASLSGEGGWVITDVRLKYQKMFTSTRGECRPHSLEEVMFTSFAPDGGMFLPEVIPTLTSAEMDSFSKASFQDITIDVLGKFVSLPSQDLSAIVTNAFAELPFEPGFTVLGDGIQICDLQNGPSLAFKDYGVAVVAGFLDYFVRQRNSGKVLNIVVATSGDTGPSAMCAVRKYPETLRLYVLYPENAISPAQKHQMISEASSAPNVHVIGGLEADSDSLDTVLTSVFSNPGDMELGSINSINVIRVLVQACFYVYIASRHLGREISVTVPSGALGNLASGLLAYRMGVPISQFIAACNVNNALSRLFTEGKLLKWKGPAKNTLSNAMDIAVPYNLWRFLYLTAADGDASLVKTWQDQYESGCEVQISPKLLSQIPVSTTTVSQSSISIFNSYVDQ